MQKTADVAIIGAGISGLSIAFELAKKGVKSIAVVDKSFPGSGATGRCGAGIRMQWGTKRNCLLSRYSVEFFENAADILENDIDVEFSQGGYLIGAGDEAEAAQFRENVKLQNSIGIPSHYLSPDEAKAMMPHLDTEKIVAATFCQRDGHLNPFKTVEAYTEAVERLGVNIYKYTEVTGILVRNGRAAGIKTDKGDIEAPVVVISAGGWSQHVAATAGVELPLFSRRHQILVTEPIEPMQTAMFMGFSLNIYIQQVPHGPFIMGRGDADEPTDMRMTSSWQFLEKMARRTTELMPRLKGLKVVRQWAGFYNMTADAQPIYGTVPDIPGLHLACGFSGHGFMLAPATGRLVSEQILGEPLTIDVSDLTMDRFHGDTLPTESSVV